MTFQHANGVIENDTGPYGGRARWGLLVAGFGACLLPVLTSIWSAHTSATHPDLFRDLLIATRMSWSSPTLIGPELAGVLHLGPLWYWFLAALATIGLSLSGIVTVISLIYASMFLLAVWIARALRLGLTGVVLLPTLLAVPSWRLHELAFLSHTSLTATFAALLVLSAIQFIRTQRSTWLLVNWFSFTIGLHWHPSFAVLVLMPICLLVFSIRRRTIPIGKLVLLGVLSSAPFWPVLLQFALDGVVGWMGQIQTYTENPGNIGRPGLAWSLLWESIGGGLRYWLQVTGSRNSTRFDVIAIGYFLLIIAGLALLCWRTLRQKAGEDRTINGIILITVVTSVPILAIMRGVYPAYMLSAVSTLMLISAGVGLSQLKWPSAVLGGFLLLVSWLHASVVLELSEQRNLAMVKFALLPSFDVTQPSMDHHSHPFLRLGDVTSLGRWLCEHSESSLHGPIALAKLHSYGIPRQMACQASFDSLELAGSDRPGVIGLSRNTFPETLIPLASLGPFQLYPIDAVLSPIEPISISLTMPPDYPPLTPSFGDPQLVQLAVPEYESGYLVVTNMGFAVTPQPLVSLDCAGSPKHPVQTDSVVWIFRTDECSAPATLELRTTQPDYINAVLISRD